MQHIQPEAKLNKVKSKDISRQRSEHLKSKEKEKKSANA